MTHCIVMEEPTRKEIQRQLALQLDPLMRARSGLRDHLFLLCYSGHGGQLPVADAHRLRLTQSSATMVGKSTAKPSDNDDSSEEDGLDECLFDVELAPLLDDEIHDWLYCETQFMGPDVVVVMDCCHSGTSCDLPYIWQPAWNSDKAKRDNHYATALEEDPQLNGSRSIVCISGCRDDQTSQDARQPDGQYRGALTKCMLDLLSNKSVYFPDQSARAGAGVSWQQFVIKLTELLVLDGYSQKPMLSSNNRWVVEHGMVPNELFAVESAQQHRCDN